MSSESFLHIAEGRSIPALVREWSQVASDLQLSEHTLLALESNEGWAVAYGEPPESVLSIVTTNLAGVGLVEVASIDTEGRKAMWRAAWPELPQAARRMGLRSLEVIDRGGVLPADLGGVVRSVVRMKGGPDLQRQSSSEIEVATPGDNGQIIRLIQEAFAGHPENGAWDISELRSRMSQSWFDPEGVFVSRQSGRIVGLCWTKVHPDNVGEIYLVAVAEHTGGSGLGRALVEHGVEYLISKQGCSDVIVYRSLDNESARRLYEGVGFVDDRVDRRLEIAV